MGGSGTSEQDFRELRVIINKDHKEALVRWGQVELPFTSIASFFQAPLGCGIAMSGTGFVGVDLADD